MYEFMLIYVSSRYASLMSVEDKSDVNISNLCKVLANLFNICSKEYSFPDFWEVSSVISKNFVRGLWQKYSPVNLLFVFSKIFEKLSNNKLFDHLRKFVLFSDFQYRFRRSRSPVDVLTVLAKRIARVSNMFGASKA